jgi:hypothetical protein
LSTYEQKKQKSQALFRRDAKHRPDETTPPTITLQIEAFAASLCSEKPIRLPVKSDPFGLYGWCAYGVSEKVRADGGNVGFGWTIWEWPRVLLTAEFHAIWIAPNGDAADITPKPHGEREIVFVPDRTYPPDFDFALRPLNKRVRLYKAPDRVSIVADKIAQMSRNQKEYESARAEKARLSLQEWMLGKVPNDDLPDLIDRVIDSCNRCDSDLDANRQPSGDVEADHTTFRLLEEKDRLLRELKTALKKLPKK